MCVYIYIVCVCVCVHTVYIVCIVCVHTVYIVCIVYVIIYSLSFLIPSSIGLLSPTPVFPFPLISFSLPFSLSSIQRQLQLIQEALVPDKDPPPLFDPLGEGADESQFSVSMSEDPYSTSKAKKSGKVRFTFLLHIHCILLFICVHAYICPFSFFITFLCLLSSLYFHNYFLSLPPPCPLFICPFFLCFPSLLKNMTISPSSLL